MPVLPPTVAPESCALVPVPSFTTVCIADRSCSAVEELTIRRVEASSSWSSSTSPPLSVTRDTMCGDTSSPSFASAADTIAICSGVAVTSNCPIPLSAVCAGSMSEGYTLV